MNAKFMMKMVNQTGKSSENKEGPTGTKIQKKSGGSFGNSSYQNKLTRMQIPLRSIYTGFLHRSETKND
jgi:hypothetical protein